MTIRPNLLAPISTLLLLTTSCASNPQPRSPLIILRFENLTGDPALDWMARAATRQIAAQIDGAAPADSPQRASDRERAIAAGATRIVHGYLTQSAGRLRLRADLEDAPSGKFLRWAESTGPLAAGLLPRAQDVARQFDPAARPSGARTEAALEAYIAGLEKPDPAAFSRSIAADPDFAAPYLALIELSLARKDRATAERTLALARARGDAIPPVDRARLDVAGAQLTGDPAALSRSLAALSQLNPADTNLLRSLGDSELAARRYTNAIGYFRQALAAQPADAALLNTLGYTQAYAGDLDGSVKTLRDYQRVRPNDANPLDSLGDVHFYWSRFPEAEKFYRQAYDKDSAFQNAASLLKAATARLFTGDAAGAEKIFAEYEYARRAAADPIADFQRAQWDHLRGKQAEAMRRIESFAAATKVREAAALADCALTVWLLEKGDRAAAAKHTACRFLTDPHGAAFPIPAARAYAFLLAKDFQAALPQLREVVARAAPNPTESSQAALGWALIETGHLDEAEQYLRTTPVPPAPALDPFQSIIFPRIFSLRAKLAERKGDRTTADRNTRLFQILTAPRN